MKKLLRRRKPKESYFKYFIALTHLWLGLLASIVVIVACLSGAVYAFKQQVDDWCNREYVFVEEKGNLPIISIDTLMLKAAQEHGKPGRLLIPEHGDGRSLQLSTGERGSAAIACYHPGTGEYLGIKPGGTASFFSTVLDLHRNLMMGQTGKMIVGSAVLIFVYLLLSGFVLWLPAKLKQLKNALLVKWNARFYRLNYDLHNVLGFYTMLFLLLISLTGLYVSFHWVKNAMIVGLGGNSVVITDDNIALKTKLADSFNALFSAVTETKKKPESTVSYDACIREVNKRFPGKGQMSVSVSDDALKMITILKYDRNNWLNFYVPNKVEFNQEGEIIKEQAYAALPLHEQFKLVAKPLHTGEIMGLGGIIIYAIVALVGASLPVTGFIIWWKKK